MSAPACKTAPLAAATAAAVGMALALALAPLAVNAAMRQWSVAEAQASVAAAREGPQKLLGLELAE